MDFMVLWIVSVILLILYATFGGILLHKYRKLLDPFIKSNISIYLIAFVVKFIFWLASWQLEKYNISISDSTQALVPIRSTLGSIVSGISFMILQIILFRIILAYYLLKL